MSQTPAPIDPWPALRAVTSARIGLGRCGDALPTAETLALQLAHARARDAIHDRVDFPALALRLAPLKCIEVKSAAADRATYLRRPDLGRQLEQESREKLTEQPCDVVFVVGDGLSSAAIAHHAEPVIRECLQRLKHLNVGPIVLAENARVALGDEIGRLIGAKLVVVLIGERPGLSSPDSLGIYITWDPKPGRKDSERNCISNVHSNGMSYAEAGERVQEIVEAALRQRATGVIAQTRNVAALPATARN